jgi:hypothetical protein
VEGITFDIEAVGAGVEFATHLQAGLGRGRVDQSDHRQTAGQRRAPPILGDVSEQAMLDLVPLGGPRRIMAGHKRDAGFIGQLLEFDLAGRDEEPACLGRTKKLS